jgi:Holliday junction resolvase
MGKMQRNKGAAYEREIVHALVERGWDAARNLTQTREGGADIILQDFILECKRRAKISLYDWLDQATLAAKGRKRPVVVARADRRESVVILRLDDFLDLVGERDVENAKVLFPPVVADDKAAALRADTSASEAKADSEGGSPGF